MSDKCIHHTNKYNVNQFGCKFLETTITLLHTLHILYYFNYFSDFLLYSFYAFAGHWLPRAYRTLVVICAFVGDGKRRFLEKVRFLGFDVRRAKTKL